MSTQYSSLHSQQPTHDTEAATSSTLFPIFNVLVFFFKYKITMVIFSCIYCNCPFDTKNGLINHLQSRCNDDGAAAAVPNVNDHIQMDGILDDFGIEQNFHDNCEAHHYHDDDNYNNNICHNDEDEVMGQTVLAAADKYDTLEELIDLDYDVQSETSDAESSDVTTENDVMEEDDDADILSDNNSASECFNNITTNSLLDYKEKADTKQAKKEPCNKI